MNRKLNRVLDDIQKTEEKIAMWQKHLKELHIQREQLENSEIIRSIRSRKLDSRELLSVLQDIECGAIVLSKEKEKPDVPSVNTENEGSEYVEDHESADDGRPDIQKLEKETLKDESRD